MCYPSRAEAWKHFDRMYPDFAEEPRNVGWAFAQTVEQTFIMRAAYMLTVNDIPAYEMESGWSIAGIMGCPVYMDNIWAFHLLPCYFDYHRQFLPKDHSYRKNKKAFTKSRIEYKVARSRMTQHQVQYTKPKLLCCLRTDIGDVQDI
ncbi:UNVERIFIED_CONTAM: hypothetical protein Scaly_1658100 [Sesamum calycinum]|uniref:Uncharacterized protein n=1 Tax=Sesamum calycinum TaxID=2727403 RepID=A0AAW2NVB5_9LAMI